jgi:hypothetical protein
LMEYFCQLHQHFQHNIVPFQPLQPKHKIWVNWKGGGGVIITLEQL